MYLGSLGVKGGFTAGGSFCVKMRSALEKIGDFFHVSRGALFVLVQVKDESFDSRILALRMQAAINDFIQDVGRSKQTVSQQVVAKGVIHFFYYITRI